MGFQTSKEKALRYSTYAYYLNRLGWEAGFEEKLTSYCMRRGTANAVDGEYYPFFFFSLLLTNGYIRCCNNGSARSNYETQP